MKGYIELTEYSSKQYGEPFVLTGESLENRKRKQLVIPKSTSYTENQYYNAFQTNINIRN